MNVTDILILLGVLVFVVLGFRDGFFKKVFGILGFLGGLIFATKFMVPFAGYLSTWLSLSDETALILAFFIIFMLFIVVVNFFYRWFGRTGSETMKFWSRIAGGFLGAAQGAVAVSLILLMLSVLDIPDADAKQESMLYDSTFQVAPMVFDYTTKWMPSSKKFFDEVRGKIENIKIK